MTLITYLTRVHFADGVLEEALWSELEASNKKCPLFLIDRSQINNELAERFFGGIPARTRIVEFDQIPSTPTERAARSVAELYHAEKCDGLVAFGTARTIDLAKVARVAIRHDEPLSTFAYVGGGSHRLGTGLPDLYAVPGIFGFGAAVSAHSSVKLDNGERALLMCKQLIPTVTICDPTLTETANAESSASSGADAITRCIEAFLSNGYNPPAEGIALDGLRRAVGNLQKVITNRSDPTARREMMAASLNGALAIQKGLGASNAISNALEVICDKRLDQGTLNRIALPGVLRFNEVAASEKYPALHDIFSLKKGEALPDGVQRYLEDLPLPRKYSELGLERTHLEAAAPVAAHDLATGTNPRKLCSGDYLNIMKSAH